MLSLQYGWKEIFLIHNVLYRHTLSAQGSLRLCKGDYFWAAPKFFSQPLLSLRHPLCVLSSWKNYHVSYFKCTFTSLGLQDSESNYTYCVNEKRTYSWGMSAEGGVMQPLRYLFKKKNEKKKPVSVLELLEYSWNEHITLFVSCCLYILQKWLRISGRDEVPRHLLVSTKRRSILHWNLNQKLFLIFFFFSL